MRVSSNTKTRATSGLSAPEKAQGGLSSIFAKKLEEVGKRQDETDRHDLELLKEQLLEVGDQLEKNQTMANFHAFRGLLAAFAKKAASIAYRVKPSPSASGLWNHDILAVINKEADELYHLVMGGQKNRIKVAAKLIALKGIIVDVIV